ncbi:hypothetical protein SKAU_G00094420 [Synaphobranchus kaupii]|uniref:Uncharacterized protein n=1 Tax=Synaphobranchus kaupii TaxID=118154 RepID=A0A9Q1FX18_SYNKA|nr:hypothetical protein SKAU_G00094420 [Synaphobranchus kaupii]
MSRTIEWRWKPTQGPAEKNCPGPVGSPPGSPASFYMVLIYGSHAPLIALTRVNGQVPFSPSSCVVMIELAKLLVSLATLLLTGGLSTLHGPLSLALVAPYAVPAVLYALNNNLVVLMQASMDHFTWFWQT